MALPVAVQLYSVRNNVSADMRATLEQVKKIGYDGVEFAGLYNNKPEDIKKMCEEIGLVPLSAHVPYVDMVKNPDILNDYKTIGCKFVAVPYLNAEDRPGTDKFGEVIENIKKIGAKANELGMTLLYHNHDFEFIKLDGKYALDILYEEVSEELLKTELDVCWVNIGGENPAGYIRKYAGRCPVVHLKDFYGEKSEDMYELIGIKSSAPKRPGNFEFRPVGSGLQNFPEILEAAEESGATWVVVEQDNPSMGLDPMGCITKSREYLRTLGY